MKRGRPLRRRTPLRTPYRLQTRPELPAVETVERMVPTGERFVYPVRRAVSPASTLQRAKVKGTYCICVWNCDGPVQPAHLIDRSITTVEQDDARAVVPLCAFHHREYDEGRLDLLPFLEPAYRAELAFAVSRVGLVSTLRRVTNDRRAVELCPNE